MRFEAGIIACAVRSPRVLIFILRGFVEPQPGFLVWEETLSTTRDSRLPKLYWELRLYIECTARNPRVSIFVLKRIWKTATGVLCVGGNLYSR